MEQSHEVLLYLTELSHIWVNRIQKLGGCVFFPINFGSLKGCPVSNGVSITVLFLFQYSDMMRERPLTRTFEDLATDIRTVTAQASSAQAVAAAASDLPPKYEDLDQPPPYVEAGSKQNP